jgi:hypothetical protein
MTVEQAKEIGRQAYTDGKPCAPACSKEIMEALKGKEVGDKYNMKIMKAFQSGWVAANLEDDIAE